VASVRDCRKALADLALALGDVDPETRARHVPRRTVACRLADLDVTFVGRLDEDGVHDVDVADDAEPDADVRLTMDSDELVALADGSDDFLHAWLRGRVQVSASMRDLLRLRSLFGL
jgi:predicted lipid carrier protein YhbT